MAYTGNIQWALRWSLDIVALPNGAGPMTVPDQQKLKLNQDSTKGAGMVVIATTGASPSSTEVTTACTTVGTNMGAAATVASVLAQIQAWNTGGG